MPYGHSKNVFSRKRVTPCFFVTFNIIKSYIFNQNFVELIKLLIRYENFLLQFYRLINWLFLVLKELMTSAYSTWCQQIFSFNLLKIGCLRVALNYINIKKTIFKIPHLIRVIFGTKTATWMLDLKYHNWFCKFKP